LPGSIAEPDVVVPMVNENGEDLSEEEKVDKLVGELRKAYKKNQSLAKANKSLRLQLHQACKKTLSQKSKHEVVREVMAVSRYIKNGNS
jgi:cytochrome c-type biogenesis protein CcmH/NrfF